MELIENIESMEIRPVENGFIVSVQTEDGENEFVFDSHHKVLRFVKSKIQPTKVAE